MMVEVKTQMANSWGDCRILQPDQYTVTFDLDSSPPTITEFSISNDVLESLDDDVKVRLYVERRLRRQSFDCGTAGNMKEFPVDILDGSSTLHRVGQGRCRWRIRISNALGHVVAQSKIAFAGAVPFITPHGNQDAILYIEMDSVENRSWEIFFEEGMPAPSVRVDKSLSDLHQEFIDGGPLLFHSLPHMISEVLNIIVQQHIDGQSVEAHPSGTWQDGWIKVLENRYHSPLPEMSFDDQVEDVSKLLSWQQKSIESVCREIEIKNRIINAREGDE